MARGVNKVTIIGNVGGDPETKYMPNGNAVTNITVATSESWKDKQTGQKQERTEWHRVSFFNRLAEIAGEYLRKGSKVYVEGSLRTRKWQDKEGKDCYTTEIIANEMQMLDSQQQGQQAPQQQNQGYQQQAPQNNQQQRQQQAPQQQQQHRQSPNQGTPNAAAFNQNQQQQSTAGNGKPPPNFDEFDDDIPFENPYKGIECIV